MSRTALDAVSYAASSGSRQKWVCLAFCSVDCVHTQALKYLAFDGICFEVEVLPDGDA